MASITNLDLNVLPNDDIHDLSNEEFSFDLNEFPEDYVDEEVENEFEENVVGADPIIDLTIDQIDEDNELHPTTNPEIRCSRRVLSNEERQLIYNALLQRSSNGKLHRHTTTEVSSLFSVPIRTIQRIWKQAKETTVGVSVDVSHKKTKNCGRKRVQVDLSSISTVPLNQRRIVRSLAHALHMSYGTVYRLFKGGHIRRHSNAIKPHLKDENKRARLQFCMSMLDTISVPLEPKFVGMYNIVHIDEKWFYMTKKSKNYYLLPDEVDPMRSCQSKNFISKVMFLTAIARPRFDAEGNEVFSGKIGVFPLVTKQPALRRSRNRDAGTLETKPITSVTKEIIRSFLLEKVIPSIQAMWPVEDARSTIFIQQDNARTHVSPEDEGFHAAAPSNGFDIRLLCQPSNSPDLNVLDLGFFSAIQALQDKECAKTVDELIHDVEKAFEEYPTKKINHVFLSLQLCMREIMKVEGSNRYKVQHMGKNRVERNGVLPRQISCELDLVEHARNLLGT